MTSTLCAKSAPDWSSFTWEKLCSTGRYRRLSARTLSGRFMSEEPHDRTDRPARPRRRELGRWVRQLSSAPRSDLPHRTWGGLRDSRQKRHGQNDFVEDHYGVATTSARRSRTAW